MLSGDVEFALSLIEALLKSNNYELALSVGLLRTLGEFVHPSTYFTGALVADEGKADAASEGTKAHDRSERSCAEFTAKVDRMIQHLMGNSSLLPSVATAVSRRLDKHARLKRMQRKGTRVPAAAASITSADLSVLVRTALGFLYNAHLFMSGVDVSAAAFRQHLVVAVKIAETVIIPFLKDVFCESVAGGEGSDALFLAAQGCFQLLTVLYFRFPGSATERMLRSNMTLQVMQAVGLGDVGRGFSRWPKLLGMMVLFNANVDSLGHVALAMEQAHQDEWPEECCVESVYSGFKTVIEAYKTGSSGAKARLVGMMEDPEPLPVARDSETLRRLCGLLETLVDESEGEDEDEDEVEADDEEPVEDDEVRVDAEEEKKNPAELQSRKTPPGFGSSQGRFRLLGHLPNFGRAQEAARQRRRGPRDRRNRHKESQRRKREKAAAKKGERRSVGRLSEVNGMSVAVVPTALRSSDAPLMGAS